MKFKHYTLRAVTIEHSYIPEATVECGSCNRCCIDLSPNLTQEEFESGKYIYTFINSPDPSKPQIAVPRTERGCVYYNNGCTIYNNRPLACRQFDCRKGHYPKYKELVKEKFNIDI